jgi:dihydrolipoamide dehydrogenase
MKKEAGQKEYDIAIIGGGPGGYVAAIRAAQLGLSVVVAEKETLGGVCLNWGCIPSKSLIHHASEFRALKDMEAFGVRIDRSGFDYAGVHARSRQAANTLADGVGGLLRKNKVEVVKALATLTGSRSIALRKPDGTSATLAAKHIIVASGSRPLAVPGFVPDENDVLSSSGMLAMSKLPKSLAILGAGAIGCEFAYVMNAFGVRVTLVEMAEHILPAEDYEVAKVLDASLRKSGIDIRTRTRAVSWQKTGEGLSIHVESEGKSEEIQAEKLLAAFGRTPNTRELGLDALGVKLDARGYVVTGDYGQTSVKGIFAIGDVVATPALAHVASKEGELAVEFIAGHAPAAKRVAEDLVPSAIYCEPQVAGFGLREDGAAAKGIRFKKSVFPFRAVGKAVAVGKTDGLVKLLSDPDTGEILGAHIVGSNATELIHELALARSGELLAEDIAGAIHAHPTLAEAVMESAKGIGGKPIHI